MKNIFLLIFISFSTYLTHGQTMQEHEKKSKAILNTISDETKSYSSMKLDFKLIIKGKDVNETQEGYAILKQEKFYYKTIDREVICDGESVWTYVIDDNECYVDALEDLDIDINPSEIMTIWEDNFSFQYVQESEKNGNKIHQIKLFPIDAKNSKYHTVIIKVNETKKQ